MKTIGLLFALLLSVFVYGDNADEKTGSVKGTVTTNEQKVAAGVTVKMVSLNKLTATDEAGAFLFTKLVPGYYAIEVSLVGYAPVTKQVQVVGGKTTTVDFQLSVNAKQLEEVVVKTGIRFANRKTEMVARMPLKNLENPQVYSVVGAALLKEQVVTSFDDALKNAPGVNRLWASTGRGNDGGGYYSLRGFSLQSKVVNGVAGATNGSPDPANIERIEVIKGPSGTLFGSSLVSFGGLINTVTKRPGLVPFGEVSFTGGSYGLTRLTADINTPLDSAGRVLLRTNASYHYENSWQDAGFKRTFFVAPSLTYHVTPKLSVDLNVNVFATEATNTEMLFLTRVAPLKVFRPQDMRIDYTRSYTSNDITIKNPVVNVDAAVKYKLGKGWVSQTLLSRSNRKSDGYYSYLSILPGDSSLTRSISNQNSYSTLTDIQQNFIGDFRIGRLRNRIVLGVDYLSQLTNNANSPYIVFDSVVYTRADVKYVNLTRASLDAKFNGGIPTKTSSLTNAYSVYGSDVLDVTDHLHVLASLRIDRFDNRGSYNQRTNTTTGAYAQTAYSPKFGATYEVLPNHMSVFANYMNGFQNLAPVTQPDGSVSIFKPQQANQWEAGVKTEMLGGKVTGAITYYDILVENVTRPHATLVGYTVQDGNIRSKGFEADIVASLFEGCNLIAGYSHNDAVNEQTDKNTNGLRPVSAGPANMVNVWLSYKQSNGILKGLGAGFGGNYASENIITNNLVTGQFILPAYTVMNATLFYDLPSLRIGLKLDNIANKQYWSGWTTVEPQMPRRFALNVAFKW
jgi:iron complex outermembrane receptor protein